MASAMEVEAFLLSKSSSKKADASKLEFEYIEQCSDVDELREIYRLLKTTERGFKELEDCAEKRLISCLSQRDQAHVQAIRQQPTELEIQTVKAEMAKWSEQQRRAATAQRLDVGPHSVRGNNNDLEHRGGREIPPVRGRQAVTTASKGGPGAAAGAGQNPAVAEAKAKPKAQKIPGYDFEAWRKYDPDQDGSDEEEDQRGRAHLNVQERQAQRAADLQRAVQHKHRQDVISQALQPEQHSEAQRHALEEKERKKGNEHTRVQEWDKARECYSRALVYNPRSAKAYCNRALVLTHLSLLDQAEDDCSRAVELDPTYVLAWKRRGVVRQKRGKMQLGLDDVRKATELDPNDKDAKRIVDEIMAEARKVGGEGAKIVEVDAPAAAQVEQTEGQPKTGLTEVQSKRRIPLPKPADEQPAPAPASRAGTLSPPADPPSQAGWSFEGRWPVRNTAPPEFDGEPKLRRMTATSSEPDYGAVEAGESGRRMGPLPAPQQEDHHSGGPEGRERPCGCEVGRQTAQDQWQTARGHEVRSPPDEVAWGPSFPRPQGAYVRVSVEEDSGDEASSDPGFFDADTETAAMFTEEDQLRRQFEQEESDAASTSSRPSPKSHLPTPSHTPEQTPGGRIAAEHGQAPPSNSDGSAQEKVAPGDLEGKGQTPTAVSEQLKMSGNDLMTAGNYVGALKCYNDALDVQPDNTKALNNRAQAYLKLELWERALADAESVLLLEPDNYKAVVRGAFAQREWAGVHIREGDFTQARFKLRRARESLQDLVAKDPHYPNARQQLEQVHDLLDVCAELELLGGSSTFPSQLPATPPNRAGFSPLLVRLPAAQPPPPPPRGAGAPPGLGGGGLPPQPPDTPPPTEFSEVFSSPMDTSPMDVDSPEAACMPAVNGVNGRGAVNGVGGWPTQQHQSSPMPAWRGTQQRGVSFDDGTQPGVRVAADVEKLEEDRDMQGQDPGLANTRYPHDWEERLTSRQASQSPVRSQRKVSFGDGSEPGDEPVRHGVPVDSPRASLRSPPHERSDHPASSPTEAGDPPDYFERGGSITDNLEFDADRKHFETDSYLDAGQQYPEQEAGQEKGWLGRIANMANRWRPQGRSAGSQEPPAASQEPPATQQMDKFEDNQMLEELLSSLQPRSKTYVIAVTDDDSPPRKGDRKDGGPSPSHAARAFVHVPIQEVEGEGDQVEEGEFVKGSEAFEPVWEEAQRLLREKDLKQAETLLLQAHHLQPHRLDCLLGFGQVSLALGEWEQAAMVADQAEILEPNDLGALSMRARALAGVEDWPNALLAWGEYMRHDKHDKEAQQEWANARAQVKKQRKDGAKRAETGDRRRGRDDPIARIQENTAREQAREEEKLTAEERTNRQLHIRGKATVEGVKFSIPARAPRDHVELMRHWSNIKRAGKDHEGLLMMAYVHKFKPKTWTKVGKIDQDIVCGLVHGIVLMLRQETLHAAALTALKGLSTIEGFDLKIELIEDPLRAALRESIQTLALISRFHRPGGAGVDLEELRNVARKYHKALKGPGTWWELDL